MSTQDRLPEVKYKPVTGNENDGAAVIIPDGEKQRTNGHSNRTFLYISACVANLAAFTCGQSFGWTSPIIPKLYSNDTSINPLPNPITADEDAWIGSFLPLGATFGPFVAGIAADAIGRKKTLIYSTAPFLLAFVLCAIAGNVTYLYVARVTFGLAVGGIFTVLPMYIGEISDDVVRGTVGSFLQLFVVVGLLFSFSIGPYVSVATFNYLCLIAPAIFLAYFTLKIPESPHYLITNGEEDEAKRSLMLLRGKGNEREVSKEFEDIRRTVREALNDKASFMDIFKSAGLTKALTLSVGLVALQQLSGINIILFYTEPIFRSTGSNIPAATATIIVGAVQVLASGLTPLFADKSGKRFLLMLSAIGMCVSEAALGFFFQLLNNGNVDVSGYSWVPVLCLVTYIFTYCLGFGPLPWAVMGELFPANIKSTASTVTAAGCWFLGFVLTKYFGAVSAMIGIHNSFYAFAGCCAFACVFVYKFLPETSGKSLQEIQDILNGKAR